MTKLYDVIYLKEIANGFAINPIPMAGGLDYQTALEKKAELDKVYNPDRIVVWKMREEFLPIWMKEGKIIPENFGVVKKKLEL